MRMMKRLSSLLLLLTSTGMVAHAADPLSVLDDDFSSNSIGDWQRVIDVESWPNDQLEVLDINTSATGYLTMVPHTNGWYEDYRGPLLFKEVTGDFVVTTRVLASNRAQNAAPSRTYSLAGIMIRAPRAITPGTWTAGGEKYSFLSTGSADTPGTFQYEVKSTSNEDDLPEYSRLDISNTDCACGDSILQTARIGDYVIQMAKTVSGPWQVVNRYNRDDLPETLQVGFVTYTDWDNVTITPVNTHNTTTLTEEFGNPGTPTQPDLHAQFDYINFVTPDVPGPFVGVDLTDPGQATDMELLSFLGGNLTSTFASVDDDIWMSY